jgi:hypothetical protein
VNFFGNYGVRFFINYNKAYKKITPDYSSKAVLDLLAKQA